MSNLKNSVRLTGYAGSDAIQVELGGHKRLARVNMAVNEQFRGRDGLINRQTQWFQLVFWDGKAEQALLSIRKGTGFSVEGRLVNHHYKTKDGQEKLSTEVVVNEITMELQEDTRRQ